MYSLGNEFMNTGPMCPMVRAAHMASCRVSIRKCTLFTCGHGGSRTTGVGENDATGAREQANAEYVHYIDNR